MQTQQYKAIENEPITRISDFNIWKIMVTKR